MLDQDTGEDAPCPTEVTQNLLDATWGLTPAHTAAWRDALDMTCALGPSVVVALRRAAMCKCQQIKPRDLSDQSHSTGRSQHANSQVGSTWRFRFQESDETDGDVTIAYRAIHVGRRTRAAAMDHLTANGVMLGILPKKVSTTKTRPRYPI